MLLHTLASWGFRRATAYTGELGIPPPPDVGGGMVRAAEREKGEKMGGGKGAPLSQTPPSAAHLFPFDPRARHRHSARREAASGTSNLHQCVCGDADTSIQTRNGERNLHQSPITNH